MTDVTLRLQHDIREILAAAGIDDPAAESTAIVEAALRQAGPAQCAEAATRMAAERAGGTPLAYLVGQVRFMGVDVFITPGALIPREETELLGRTALGLLAEAGSSTSPRLIDMCCGSGNLGCALAVTVPSATIWSSDLTDGAVNVARANVTHLGLDNRVTVLQGDLFSSLSGLGLEGSIDMVVCNPPYISSGKLEKERTDLLAHEPREAFDGGPYGVSIFQRVIRDAVAFLKPGSHLLFEIGMGQERQVSLLFGRVDSYEPAIVVPDASGVPRVIVARKR